MGIFTRQERNAIVFAAALALLGAGLDCLYKKIPAARGIRLASERQMKTNINEADMRALMDVPGIGNVTARRILEYRQRIGRIQDLEELRSLKGITPKRFERLQEQLAVE
ncbi:MAG: helix-hairpin-helix domain-containing protein [Candidatus Omnitrophica bacterium]|nr:helix-hairpin-helix domain-containing protein [Candidatus Omnitrophota bacterium]